MSNSTQWTQSKLEALELELEEESMGHSPVRFEKMLEIKGGVAGSQSGARLMRASIQPLTDAIESWVKDATTKKTGRRASAGAELVDVDPASIALLTLRTIVNSIQSAPEEPALGKVIGSMVAEHVGWANFKKADPENALRLERFQLQPVGNEKHRRGVERGMLKQYNFEAWDHPTVVRIGRALLELAIQTTGLVERDTKFNPRNRRNTVTIVAVPAVLERLEASLDREALTMPLFGPMVIPPAPWTSPVGGGYRFRLQSNTLMKTYNQDILDEMAVLDLSSVYDAVNTLQATPYKVNARVLTVIEALRADNMEAKDLRLHRPGALDQPVKPAAADDRPEVLHAWKKEVHAFHKNEVRRASRRKTTDSIVATSAKLRDIPAIYFPHTLDWRGRAYPVPVGLQPQGNDMAKGLLHYAEGKPMGPNGAYWLYVHIANLFGEDKKSLDGRVEWVAENLEQLLACANNPLDEDLWHSADKPWQALAALFELRDYTIAAELGSGEDYVSHLPIAMDGSCNGLQNLSAMLLDEVGGAAVNLTPSDLPKDIYQAVADRVINNLRPLASGKVSARELKMMVTLVGNWQKSELKRIKRDEERGIPAGHIDVVPEEQLEEVCRTRLINIAKHWVSEGINRKLAKRPVMTKPYGSSGYGITKQLRAELEEHPEWIEATGEAAHIHANILRGPVQDAIAETVVAAKEVMDWLQETAKVAAKAGYPLRWITPLGLPVLQDYRERASKRTCVTVGGTKLQFRVAHTSEKMDVKRSSNGMSPNVIHSLDASHMMLTLLRCRDAGVTNFTMVHDSYATHAGLVDVMNETLRDAFIELYQLDVMADLHEQFKAQLPAELAADLPEVPAKGNLNLEDVRASLYFFA